MMQFMYNLFMVYIDIESIEKRCEKVSPFFAELNRRILSGAKSSLLIHGGIAALDKEAGLLRNTMKQGQKDLQKLKYKVKDSKNMQDTRKQEVTLLKYTKLEIYKHGFFLYNKSSISFKLSENLFDEA
ncbi:MAG: hypothetical protein JSV88_07865 [Candidatus Aminicenantes bacterium]|nr:MAG: hypothetical protein JSV88_07865 [Candidatus Aminicenantes bacterium]